MAKFEIRQTTDNQYYWRLAAANGEIVAVSESYTTKYSAIHSARRIQEIAGSAKIIDYTN